MTSGTMGRRGVLLLGTAAAAIVGLTRSARGVELQPAPPAGVHSDCDSDDLGASPHEHISKRSRFEILDNVSLSSKVEEKLSSVADKFHKKTGKTFVVTSGTRDPDNQALLIYVKLEAGEDLLKLYKDKSAVMELVRVYESSREEKKSKSATVARIATAIRAQIKRGIYISAHLRAGAADVRSSNMSPEEKRTFAELARDAGLSVMLEATPPHFHLQMDL